MCEIIVGISRHVQWYLFVVVPPFSLSLSTVFAVPPPPPPPLLFLGKLWRVAMSLFRWTRVNYSKGHFIPWLRPTMGKGQLKWASVCGEIYWRQKNEIGMVCHMKKSCWRRAVFRAIARNIIWALWRVGVVCYKKFSCSIGWSIELKFEISFCVWIQVLVWLERVCSRGQVHFIIEIWT